MSYKTTRSTRTVKQVIASPQPEPEEYVAKSETPASQCGMLDIEELAKKEGDLHKLIETDLVELFESLDTYGRGHLNTLDIKSAFQTFDIEITDEDSQAILEAFDLSGEGQINFPEFRAEMHDVMMGGTREEHLKLVEKTL